MRTLFFILLIACSPAFSQAKFEIQEFTGKVNSIRPGWSFALESIDLQIDGDIRSFRLDPEYGKSILSKIQVGQLLSIKAKVNPSFHEAFKKDPKLKAMLGNRFSDQIIEIKLGDAWIQTPALSQSTKEIKKAPVSRVFLEQKIEGDFHFDGLRKGLIFKNGMIAFALYVVPKFNLMKHLAPGNTVSFIGYESPVKEKYAYPIEGIKSVYSFVELKKIEGTIESYVYKQNFLRIGMKINGKRLSFPGDRARDIERFANGEKILVYFDAAENPMSNLLPTIHAIVQNGDTLYMPIKYYGGPDSNHEHTDVQIEGEISKINRSGKGRIISLIVNKDCFIEVDPQMDQQLGDLLKKGIKLKISGEERVKRDGEIYEKDYRIIIPKRISTESREFILNR